MAPEVPSLIEVFAVLASKVHRRWGHIEYLTFLKFRATLNACYYMKKITCFDGMAPEVPSLIEL